jgi:hypothetical protein
MNSRTIKCILSSFKKQTEKVFANPPTDDKIFSCFIWTKCFNPELGPHQVLFTTELCNNSIILYKDLAGFEPTIFSSAAERDDHYATFLGKTHLL